MSAQQVKLMPGVWGVLATPFHGPDHKVDHRSLEAEVGCYLRLGATGVVALGVFGEAASLSRYEQGAILSTVVGASQGMPVVAGLSARDTTTAAAQARVLSDAADGVLAAVMAQVNTADPIALRRHLETLHEVGGVPIVVQDYPAISGITIQPATLARVIDQCSFVAAVKCESPPTAAAISVLARSVKVPLFGGLGGVGLVDELEAGAAGAMTGFSYPEGLIATVRAHGAGGFDAARDAFSPWLPLAVFENQPGIGLAIRKEILRRRGLLASADVRPPARVWPTQLAPLIEQHLSALPQPSARASGTPC